MSLSDWEQRTIKSDSCESESKEKITELTKKNLGSLVGKKRARKPEETESDSDYDDINLIA